MQYLNLFKDDGNVDFEDWEEQENGGENYEEMGEKEKADGDKSRYENSHDDESDSAATRDSQKTSDSETENEKGTDYSEGRYLKKKLT